MFIAKLCVTLILITQSCIAFPKSLKQCSTKKILLSHIYIDTMRHLHVDAHAEIRSRYEKYWNDNWGGAPKDNNGYLLHRLLFFTDIKFSNKVIIRAEVKSALHSNLNIPPRPVDEDKLDFQKLYLEYKLQGSDTTKGIIIKAGRQELIIGSGRLFDQRDYTNALISFDGLYVTAKKRKWEVNVFALQQSRQSFGVFDNLPDADRTIWGLYSTKLSGDSTATNFDYYYIGQKRKRISYSFGDFQSFFDQGAYSETRHMAGLRIYNHINSLDYDIEPIYQSGRYSKNNQTISAWRIGTTIGYTFRNVNFKPRLYCNVDLSSGDKDSTDNKLNTFYSPYPDILDPSSSNISGFKIGANATLKNKMSINVFGWFFWRSSNEDGICGFLGFPYRAAGKTNRKYVGAGPTAVISWLISTHITFMTLYGSQFVADGFLKSQPPAKNLSYVGMSVTYKY